MNKDEKALKKEQKRIQKQNEIHPLKYKKAGRLLTRAQVAEIKASKKKLRARMKSAGITDRADRKILEVSSGAYFDQRKSLKALEWIFKGRVLVFMLIALVASLSVLFAMSEITKMKGHFTINITPSLFEEGFSLGESLDPNSGSVNNPTSNLKGDLPGNGSGGNTNGEAADAALCTSISDIAKSKDLGKLEGSIDSGDFFAYGFYIENRGSKNADYAYELVINSQSKDAAKVAWVLMYIDDKVAFYAKKTDDGYAQTLPARDDTSRGYKDPPPFMGVAGDEQYELISTTASGLSYYRLIALPFESDNVVTSGQFTGVAPGEKHKYTVVVWIEGDDPDCTNDMIGGHFGVELNFVSLE